MRKYITIFTIVDDFCKTYEAWIKHKIISFGKHRMRSGKLSLSEYSFSVGYSLFSSVAHNTLLDLTCN